MIAVPRRLAVFLLGVAALALGVAVVIVNRDLDTDLLAGAAMGAGLAIVLWVAPPPTTPR